MEVLPGEPSKGVEEAGLKRGKEMSKREISSYFAASD